jgi:hypothetical protein
MEKQSQTGYEAGMLSIKMQKCVNPTNHFYSDFNDSVVLCSSDVDLTPIDMTMTSIYLPSLKKMA